MSILTESPQLFMEFHATHEDALEQTIALIQEICEDNEATQFRATTDARERKDLWYARHHAFESFPTNAPR